MEKIVIAMIGQDAGLTLSLCLESIKKADVIVYVDGGSKDNSVHILRKNGFVGYTNKDVEILKNNHRILINRPYDKEDKRENGRARQYYLDFIKKHYPDYWCVVIDPDEAVENFDGIQYSIKIITDKYPNQKNYIFAPRMIHFIQDLAHEDSTFPEHFCPTRFFKVSPDINYEEEEHPCLQCKETTVHGNTSFFTIYHFGYCKDVFHNLNRYKGNLKKSEMHSPRYLKDWYYNHITGNYLKKDFDIAKMPQFIKDYFMLEDVDDFLYFKDRRIFEGKHFINCHNLRDEFKPKKVLFVGCGMSQRVWTMNKIGVEAYGCDKSSYAVKHSTYARQIADKVFVADVTKDKSKDKFDLICVYDILEHIEEKDLQTALKYIVDSSTEKATFFFSIPFLGNRFLHEDSTHKIFQSKEWWIEQIQNAGIKIKETPNRFNYKEMTLVGVTI